MGHVKSMCHVPFTNETRHKEPGHTYKYVAMSHVTHTNEHTHTLALCRR